MTKVLVSFVGISDITGGRDTIKKEGPLLNIMRNEGPFNNIIIFISKGIKSNLGILSDNEINIEDDSIDYFKCLRTLAINTKFIIKECDNFYDDDNGLLKYVNEEMLKIEEEYHENDSYIYLNTSSGTPQMMYSLKIYYFLSSYKSFKLLSVKKPDISKGEIKSQEKSNKSSLFTYDDFITQDPRDNRVIPDNSLLMLKNLEIDSRISTLLAEYNYSTAEYIINNSKLFTDIQKEKVNELFNQISNYLDMKFNNNDKDYENLVKVIHAYTRLSILAKNKLYRDFIILTEPAFSMINSFLLKDKLYQLNNLNSSTTNSKEINTLKTYLIDRYGYLSDDESKSIYRVLYNFYKDIIDSGPINILNSILTKHNIDNVANLRLFNLLDIIKLADYYILNDKNTKIRPSNELIEKFRLYITLPEEYEKIYINKTQTKSVKPIEKYTKDHVADLRSIYPHLKFINIDETKGFTHEVYRDIRNKFAHNLDAIPEKLDDNFVNEVLLTYKELIFTYLNKEKIDTSLFHNEGIAKLDKLNKEIINILKNN